MLHRIFLSLTNLVHVLDSSVAPLCSPPNLLNPEEMMRPATLWQCPSLTLAGELNAAMIERCDAWIHDQLKAETPPARTAIFLTSGGGSNIIGRGLYDRLLLFQSTLNIHLVGMGMVGSAALYLGLAVPRGLFSGVIRPSKGR